MPSVDPSGTGSPRTPRLGAPQQIEDLQPGEFVDIEVQVPAPGFGSLDIWAFADDDGTGTETGSINECREDNNGAEATANCGPQ